MKKSFVFCIAILLLNIKVRGQEQDTIFISNNNSRQEAIAAKTDSAWIKNEKIELDKKQLITESKFKPSPQKAVIYSAIFPGLGQIYNKKYWKLPIIYGGFIALTYGISWNGQYYNDYKSAYSGIAGDNPRANFNKWKDMANLPSTVSPSEISDENIQRYKSQFKRKKDFYRRNRDLCIIGIAAVYAVCMIDAYVDAQLFDFDISPDLSLRVEPAVMEPTISSNRSFGVQCSFKF